VKSAVQLGGGQVFSADVQGISLSNLVKRTSLAYKPDATPEEQTGGLIIVKMDVEGAEYQVLKEVAASGVLCDLAKQGNRIVMIVEYHNMSITNGDERRREKSGADVARKTLEECGIEFGNLQAYWA
jgi:Methyltransferase FkbM domain